MLCHFQILVGSIGMTHLIYSYRYPIKCGPEGTPCLKYLRTIANDKFTFLFKKDQSSHTRLFLADMSLSQLSRLLPLPEPDLQQVLDYAATLSKQEAADHFNDLLGESPQSIEFISSFNSKRQSSKLQHPSTSNESNGVPKPARRPPKKKAPLHTPTPRQIHDTYAGQGTAYKKKDEHDFMTRKPIAVVTNSTPASSSSSTLSLQPKADAIQAPTRAPPSAAGVLISDFKSSKSNPTSRNTSRTSSPAPQTSTKTKINIIGGTSMHGASTVLKELDDAIRSLEISTNSTLLLDAKKRACNCIGARHPLLTAAPNCLNCGKVICVKEGLGPCTFCGEPLLSAIEVQGMIRELREERGREKMLLDNSSHRRAEVSKKPAPFSAARPESTMTPAEAKAKEHRDKLLNFQAQNAARTTVRDEAADFDYAPIGGTNMWASPAERAKQLKRQQKILAEQEWNARPEYEKRKQVVSIDVVKGKVVKRMAAVERPQFDTRDDDEEEPDLEDRYPLNDISGNKGGGTFSRNPLLGGLIRPVWDSGKGKGKEGEEELQGRPKKTWRRVQDDLDDNEQIILDGGAYGGSGPADRMEHEEPAC